MKSNTDHYHFILHQYADMDKSVLVHEGLYKSRNDLAEYLSVMPQAITDHIRGKSGMQKRRFNKMCYVNIDKGKFTRSDLMQEEALLLQQIESVPEVVQQPVCSLTALPQ